MTPATLPQDSRDLALELRALLEQIEPGRWSSQAVGGLRSQLVALRDGIGRLIDGVDAQGTVAALVTALREVRRVLTDHLPDADLAATEARRAWRRLRKELLAVYEKLSVSLAPWDIHVPSMRPTNYARNVFHVSNGVMVLAAVSLLSEGWLRVVITAIFVWAWSMEILRRGSPRLNAALMKTFAQVAHPHEAWRVNSATWYATALLVVTWLGWLTAGLSGALVLAVGDPVAAVVGRRWGRHRIRHGRSVEGSLGFFVTGAAASFLGLLLVRPELGWPVALLTSFIAAVCGAVAEIVSLRVDDNLTIPLSASLGAALVLAAAGAAL